MVKQFLYYKTQVNAHSQQREDNLPGDPSDSVPLSAAETFVKSNFTGMNTGSLWKNANAMHLVNLS